MVYLIKNYVLMVFLGMLLAIWGGQLHLMTSAVVAQGIIQPENVAAIVYQKLPEIPLENQYIRKESGQIDPDHTLISRLVRYHRDVQRRTMRYRFDWKLTFADYLGINEPIKAENYPGHDTLSQNPLENDLKAIRQLNRRQRQAIVDLLASIYDAENPNSQGNTAENNENEGNPTVESPAEPSKPPLSQPGDAQLLMP